MTTPVKSAFVRYATAGILTLSFACVTVPALAAAPPAPAPAPAPVPAPKKVPGVISLFSGPDGTGLRLDTISGETLKAEPGEKDADGFGDIDSIRNDTGRSLFLYTVDADALADGLAVPPYSTVNTPAGWNEQQDGARHMYAIHACSVTLVFFSRIDLEADLPPLVAEC
jgi:hypothetical protein